MFWNSFMSKLSHIYYKIYLNYCASIKLPILVLCCNAAMMLPIYVFFAIYYCICDKIYYLLLHFLPIPFEITHASIASRKLATIDHFHFVYHSICFWFPFFNLKLKILQLQKSMCKRRKQKIELIAFHSHLTSKFMNFN